MPKLRLTNKVKEVSLHATQLDVGMYRVIDSADSVSLQKDEIVIVSVKANLNEKIITPMGKFVSYQITDISQQIRYMPLENNTQLTFNN
jgi:hypothetical protein